MATVHGQSPFRQLRGKVGDLVFKWYGDRRVVTRAPRPSSKPRSAKQRQSSSWFSRASKYAQKAKHDEKVWPLYLAAAKKQLVPTRSVAMHDFMAKPKPLGVLLRSYNGGARDRVLVVLGDRYAFKTVAIDVTMRNQAGQILARGPAKCRDDIWEFGPGIAVRAAETLVFELTARDRFGKTGQMTCSGRPGDRKLAKGG